jgi:acetolactate decarboxylase
MLDTRAFCFYTPSMTTHAPHQLKIALPGELLDDLRKEALRTGLSETEIVQQALRRHLSYERGGNAVYLSAPINALVEGLFVSNTTVAQIKRHGDFGLGTFNYLDGEMVILDGVVYQVRSDGNVTIAPDADHSPFACTTFFRPDTFEEIEGDNGFKDIETLLDMMLPSPNMLYAIRIDGTFRHIKTRAVAKSENYIPLVEATKNQPVFDFYDCEGCMAGFFTPRFIETITAPGYHLHFLTADRMHGGHVIGCALTKVRIGIQHVPVLKMGLPITLDFLTADLTRDTTKDLEKAER